MPDGMFCTRTASLQGASVIGAPAFSDRGGQTSATLLVQEEDYQAKLEAMRRERKVDEGRRGERNVAMDTSAG
jgi:hypothetical protein